MNEIKIYPLSENAITIETGNAISKENHYKILSLQRFIHQLNIPGFIETVPAYCTLTVYYDPLQIIKKIPEAGTGVSNWLIQHLESSLVKWQPQQFISAETNIIEIPVCYEEEYGIDLSDAAAYHHSTKEEIINIHSTNIYRVYMMGFSPGFPYMGILPDSIATPRKNQPRLKVPAGSVAIAGNQTGIYPLESPGGWNIIGRTPLKLFNKEKENPFLLNTGDIIKFIPVTKETFNVLASHD